MMCISRDGVRDTGRHVHGEEGREEEADVVQDMTCSWSLMDTSSPALKPDDLQAIPALHPPAGSAVLSRRGHDATCAILDLVLVPWQMHGAEKRASGKRAVPGLGRKLHICKEAAQPGPLGPEYCALLCCQLYAPYACCAEHPQARCGAPRSSYVSCPPLKCT